MVSYVKLKGMPDFCVHRGFWLQHCPPPRNIYILDITITAIIATASTTSTTTINTNATTTTAI